MGLNDIVVGQQMWYLFLAPAPAVVFFLTSLAEVGRSPFDLVEADSELVSGFNIEYSGLKFGMFYVAEFLHAFTISVLFSVLFLGGWRGPGAENAPFLGVLYLLVKTFLVYFLVILFRGSLPRLRTDQMMDFNWKILTPLALASVVAIAVVEKALTGTPDAVRYAGLFLVNVGLLVATLQLMRVEGRQNREANDASAGAQAETASIPDHPSI
jgi:NADH-quinone oxidoreductase subunit H